uniref:Fungal cellulose binding domain-containing protein n=1 Tax=Archangium gephyra TaxID=48 RepID=A0A7D5SM44_9BACT|nr:fungal cellulose binding domain-containing protein [Archangium gephyra]
MRHILTMGTFGRVSTRLAGEPQDVPFITCFSSGPWVRQHSGRVLSVPGASTSDGVKLTQFSNWGVDNERWLLESTGDGYFTVRARHSGKCMDVGGASTAAGANVIQYTCNGSNNQRFRLVPSNNGHFALQAKHSNQCLGIAGASMDDGGFLVQSPCAWTTNESFRFAP